MHELYDKLKLTLPNINELKNVSYQPIIEMNNTMAIIENINRDKFRKEEEQRNNIQRIADNSEETVATLKEQNEILKQNNALLNKELLSINKILGDLFNLSELNADESLVLMKEANEIAKQIEISIIQNGKFDFKGLLAGTTTTGFFMGLQVYLHSKGLI